MKCDVARKLLREELERRRGGLLWLHLCVCGDCRAEAAEIRAVETALREAPRHRPPADLLGRIVASMQRNDECALTWKERITMKKLAYGIGLLIIFGVLVPLLLRSPDSGGSGSLLVSAAHAMAEADTLHVRGQANLGDAYHSWATPQGSFEYWYSPEGFRCDFYDEEDNPKRSLMGHVSEGQVWQYFPHAVSGGAAGGGGGAGFGGAVSGGEGEQTPVGTAFSYTVSSDAMARYIEVSRRRLAEGQLRLAAIMERGHNWTEQVIEQDGRSLTVIVENLGSDMVTGEPRGWVEYYLDATTGNFVGLRQYGPEQEGAPLQAEVELVEYEVDIPADILVFEPPAGSVIREGDFTIRDSGDIVFTPGPDFRAQSLLQIAYETLHYAGMGAVPWEEAEAAYLAVLEEDPENYVAREYLGRMYTRRGSYEKALAMLPEGEGCWSPLNRAFCFDALGRREEAVAIYTGLAELPLDSSRGAWARLGLRQPTWPVDADVSAEPGEVRLNPGGAWSASAFGSCHPLTPEAAIDGDGRRCWASGGDPSNDGQAPGNWFELDFGRPIRVTRMLLDHRGQGAFVNNWPRGIRASFTSDGVNWREVDVSQGGPMRPATVRFESPQMVRAIRFETTKLHVPEWWSIHEIYVYAPAG